MNHGMYYNLIYSPSGEKLHEESDAMHIFYWNDACWNRCVPVDSSGLSYLDIGHHQGGFLLRFEQRGGTATGLDRVSTGEIGQFQARVEAGELFQSESAEQIRSMWGGKYRLLRGGFANDSSITPEEVGVFSIVACLNVIEYMDQPCACAKSLFRHASDRVLIATDTAEKTEKIANSVLKQKTSIADLASISEWHFDFAEFDGGPCQQRQVFACFTNPSSKLARPCLSNITYDRTLKLTETQKLWLQIAI